jgi:hypothetical protein
MKGNRSGYNKEFAATVLIAALFTSDDKACSKFGITTRTLQNYRRRLITDTELSEAFATRKAKLDEAWSDDFLIPLRKAALVIDEAFEEIRKDPRALKNPMLITAVSEAAATCADIVLTKEAIHAQFGNQDQPANQLPEEVSPSLAVEYSC